MTESKPTDSKKRKVSEEKEQRPLVDPVIQEKGKVKLFDAGYVATPEDVPPPSFKLGDNINHAQYSFDDTLQILKESEVTGPKYRVGDVVKINVTMASATDDSDTVRSCKDARITRVVVEGERYAYDYKFLRSVAGGTLRRDE